MVFALISGCIGYVVQRSSQAAQTNVQVVNDKITLNILSYNLLNPGLTGNPKGTYDNADDNRMKGIAGVISGGQYNIVATQENSTGAKAGLMKYLPAHYKVTDTGPNVDDAVVYDSRIFKQVDFGTYTIPKIGVQSVDQNRTRDSVWVKLQFKSSPLRHIYVFSVHADRDPAGRLEGAKTVVKEINKIRNKDPKNAQQPMIVMGDMNSGYYSNNEVYTTFKNSGLLALSFENTNNRWGTNCDTISSPDDGKQDCYASTGRHADQIWVSKSGGQVHFWANWANDGALKLSDHNPVQAVVTFDLKPLPWPNLLGPR